MSRRRRKRKIRITVEARNPDDAKRIAHAIQQAVNESNSDEQAPQPTSEAPSESVEPARTFANEQVETEANRRVGSHLDEKAEQVKASNEAADDAPDARKPDSPEELVAKRVGFKNWLKTAAGLGYRVTVKVVADLVKEMANPS